MGSLKRAAAETTESLYCKPDLNRNMSGNRDVEFLELVKHGGVAASFSDFLSPAQQRRNGPIAPEGQRWLVRVQ